MGYVGKGKNLAYDFDKFHPATAGKPLLRGNLALAHLNCALRLRRQYVDSPVLFDTISSVLSSTMIKLKFSD